MSKIQNTLFRAPIKVFLNIDKNNYISYKLSRVSNITFSYTQKILQLFEENLLLKRTRNTRRSQNKRIRVIKLTPDGKIIQKYLKEIMDLLK